MKVTKNDKITVFVRAVVLICATVSNLYGQENTFKKDEIAKDLDYLKEVLLKSHPNIFVYSTEIEFDQLFERLKNQTPEKVTEFEAYGIITSISSVVKDGHTLFFPDPASISYHNTYSRFFPFRVYWDGSDLFIYENLCEQSNIPDGTKILSINGIATQELMNYLLYRMMRDGENLNYPIWVLNNYFIEYYSYYFGHPNEFSISFEDVNGNKQDVVINGITKTDIRKHIQNKVQEKAIYVEFDKEKSIAVLTIKDWHNDILRKQYNQKFKREINKILPEIEDLKIRNMIIDVRNNQGGDTKNSKLLLSYLLKEPFRLVEKYKKVDKKRKHAKQQLVNCRGPQMGIHKPKPNAYHGQLFVLINGGSFSNTGIFCSVLQKFKRATFIGEGTGGNEYVICGDIINIELPNTKIRVEVPALQFLIKDYTDITPGNIKPDYEVKPTIEDLIAGKDKIKESALNLIKER